MTNDKKEIEKKIDEVLAKIRPFLAREGGNVVLDRFDIDTGICYVNMIGACAGCSLASYDVSESIEVMLMDEVEEVKKVELVQDEVQQDYSDLLRQLQEEQLASAELEKIRKEREEKDKKD